MGSGSRGRRTKGGERGRYDRPGPRQMPSRCAMRSPTGFSGVFDPADEGRGDSSPLTRPGQALQRRLQRVSRRGDILRDQTGEQGVEATGQWPVSALDGRWNPLSTT